MSRRLVYSTALTMFLIAGCSATPSHNATTKPAVLPDAAASVAPDPATRPADEALTSAQALAMKTSAYVQDMKGQIERRTKPPTTEPTVQFIEPAMPKLEFLQPREFHFGPPQDPIGPDKVSSPTPVAVAPRPEPLIVPPPSLRESPIATTDELAQKLLRTTKENPRNLTAHLDWQLLQLLMGRQVPQMEAIAALPAEDREVIAAVMDALTNFRATASTDDNALLYRKARPFVELADRLRPQSGLRIPTITLCSRVIGFGIYDPVASDRFLAGHEYSVIMYCEVENFSSQQNEQRMWQTSLTQEAVIYNDRGQSVWDDKRRAVTDLSRNRRHDFFINRMIKLPATLPAGHYSLKVTLTDQQVNRLTQATLPIQVVDRVPLP